VEQVQGDAPHRHAVQFYERPSSLIAQVSRYVVEGLRSTDEAAIVICTADHLASLESELASAGIDPSIARDQGRYVALDAVDTLRQFMVADRPDRSRFVEVVGGELIRAQARYPRVRAFGEMVAVLWANGQSAAALELEEMWNELLGHHPFSLLCAYSMGALGRPTSLQTITDIAKVHDHVIGSVEANEGTAA
jgi:hypothetical protein